MGVDGVPPNISNNYYNQYAKNTHRWVAQLCALTNCYGLAFTCNVNQLNNRQATPTVALSHHFATDPFISGCGGIMLQIWGQMLQYLSTKRLYGGEDSTFLQIQCFQKMGAGLVEWFAMDPAVNGPIIHSMFGLLLVSVSICF